jgi:hypothetical protein
MHSPEEICQALEAHRALEEERPGLHGVLALYTDGEGYLELKDNYQKFFAAVDFTDLTPLLRAVELLRNEENHLEAAE